MCPKIGFYNKNFSLYVWHVAEVGSRGLKLRITHISCGIIQFRMSKTDRQKIIELNVLTVRIRFQIVEKIGGISPKVERTLRTTQHKRTPYLFSKTVKGSKGLVCENAKFPRRLLGTCFSLYR